MKSDKILFIDVETVPSCEHFSLLGEWGQSLFEKKYKKQLAEAGYYQGPTPPHIYMPPEVEHAKPTRDEIIEKVYQDNAALCAEFAKIVSVGFGYLSGDGMRIKTIVSKDEQWLLAETAKMIDLNNFTHLCGHNFDGFDGPMMCRRMVVNRVNIPIILNPTNKKPWELSWIDTMKMWGMGEFNYKCSLERLCFILGLPSPKADMDGSQVKDLFYGATPGKEDLPFGKFAKESDRFADIAKYQAGDIAALVNVFLRLNGESIIPEAKIVIT